MTRSLPVVAGLLAMSILTPSAAKAAEPYCREFTKQIYVAGKMQQGYGTACLQPDGDWKVVSDIQPEPDFDNERVIYYEEPVTVIKQAPVYYEPRYTYYDPYYDPWPRGYSYFSLSITDDHHNHGRKYGHNKRGHNHHH